MPDALSGVVAALMVAAGLAACSSPPTTQPASDTSTAATTVPQPPLAAPRNERWIDLEVGDCLADPPPTDPAVVIVTVVDCAAPHSAEVFLRAPVAVNAAVADVADQECEVGFHQYTGHALAASSFGLAYLIDSNQDRTSDNPDPSTVICLLQDRQPTGTGSLTGSARRP